MSRFVAVDEEIYHPHEVGIGDGLEVGVDDADGGVVVRCDDSILVGVVDLHRLRTY